MRPFASGFLLCLALSAQAAADGRHYIGYGRLLTNDVIGDTQDRWRTGSLASSRVWGAEWTGVAPDTLGQVLELRLNGEIIGPENLIAPDAGDRPLAHALSLGLHSHATAGGVDVSFGGDLVFTGEQTQLDHVQDLIHDVFGGKRASPAVEATRLGNDVFPTLVSEASREFAVGRSARLRPFVEGRVGVESLIRAGADLVIGEVGLGGLMVREPVTGHRYRVIEDEGQGLSFVLGADIAHVADSAFLPESAGYDLTDARRRVRAGVHWQGQKGSNLFYGVTWLDKEFEAQREAQVVGSMRLQLRF